MTTVNFFLVRKDFSSFPSIAQYAGVIDHQTKWLSSQDCIRSILSLGAVGGSLAYYRIGKSENRYDVKNAYITNYTPGLNWDNNWDHREPESLVQPPRSDNPKDQNRYNEEIETAKSTAVRHIFLIRHGQYHHEATGKKGLTGLGRKQAELTGQRLASLNIGWDLIVMSTMQRAIETANIIRKTLAEDIEVRKCQLIREGQPIRPDPPARAWRPEVQYFRDGARMEAAFRHYFYRAPPEQLQDSHTLLVCHANVIRFFVCRALQFPPEGWCRLALNHGSITWLSILPDGIVVLQSLGETGHMGPEDMGD